MYPTQYINNWDLVDLSSHEILGTYLLDKPEKRNILISLAKSKSLWERRIAMVACYALLRKNQFDETFAVSEILLHDEHDLIHKAVGWMLREVGKRERSGKSITKLCPVRCSGMPLSASPNPSENFIWRNSGSCPLPRVLIYILVIARGFHDFLVFCQM